MAQLMMKMHVSIAQSASPIVATDVGDECVGDNFEMSNQHDSLNQIQLFEIYEPVIEKSYVDS